MILCSYIWLVYNNEKQFQIILKNILYSLNQ